MSWVTKEVWAVKVWEPVVGAVQNCWQKGDCSEAVSWFKLALFPTFIRRTLGKNTDFQVLLAVWLCVFKEVF